MSVARADSSSLIARSLTANREHRGLLAWLPWWLPTWVPVITIGGMLAIAAALCVLGAVPVEVLWG